MSFVHLHVHSTHSPLDGYTSVEEYFQKAERLGMPGLAITDHGLIEAVPDIIKSARKHPSVKPIIGVEAYITDHYSHKDKSTDKRKCFHVLLLAKNETGFKNLCALCLIAKTDGMMLNKPRISHELLEKYHEGLICTTACIGGEIQQAFLNNDSARAQTMIEWYKQLFRDDFYFEVSLHNSENPEVKNNLYEKQQYVNEQLFKNASAYSAKVIATNDVHYLEREDGPSQDAVMCKNMHMRFESKDRIKFSGEEYFKTEEEMRSLFTGHEEVIDNTIDLLDKIESYNLDDFLKQYEQSEIEVKSIRIKKQDEKSSTSILGLMDKVVSILVTRDKCSETHFEEHKIPLVETELKSLAEKLDITEHQAMMFSLMFDRIGYRNCAMDEFADYLDITTLRAYSFNDDYEALRKKWYIRMSPEGNFRIPKMVIRSMMLGKAFKKPDFKDLDSSALILQIEDFINYVAQAEYSIEEAVEDAETALAENPGTGYAKVYEKYDIRNCMLNEKYLFLSLVNARFNNGKESVPVNSLHHFNNSDFCALRNRIYGGSLKLQKSNVIVFENCDGMITKGQIKINEDVLSEICEDAPVLLEGESPVAGVILPDNIVKKELFFSAQVQSNISTISSLLEEQNYLELKRSLKQNGMREGFTCLFYGAPGTGKTESVYQLAKESGRELFEIDVASLMNCYVGETEKNTRRVFEKYRRSARGNKKAPILLFNEADAILGKRMKGAEREVDRMGNSVQNIILQEMEKLDGIMIATTNLTENLDPAFERRFLYKVKFENPTKELRSKIWSGMIPDLKDDELAYLSCNYNFSGGQIENIARKRSIARILSGKDVTFEQVCSFCSEEQLQEKAHTRIGFNF